MEDVIQEILQANDLQIDLLLQAVLRRFGQLRPHVELSVLTLDRDGDRKQDLVNIISYLENMKTSLIHQREVFISLNILSNSSVPAFYPQTTAARSACALRRRR